MAARADRQGPPRRARPGEAGASARRRHRAGRGRGRAGRRADPPGVGRALRRSREDVLARGGVSGAVRARYPTAGRPAGGTPGERADDRGSARRGAVRAGPRLHVRGIRARGRSALRRPRGPTPARGDRGRDPRAATRYRVAARARQLCGAALIRRRRVLPRGRPRFFAPVAAVAVPLRRRRRRFTFFGAGLPTPRPPKSPDRAFWISVRTRSRMIVTMLFWRGMSGPPLRTLPVPYSTCSGKARWSGFTETPAPARAAP